MCDPTVLAIASTVAGLAGTAVNYMGQQSAQNEQEQAYNAWAAQQHKNRVEENARQDAERVKAIAAQKQGLADISADAQKRNQATEETRLTGYLQGQDQRETGGTPVSVADRALTGSAGGGDVYQSDLAGKLAQATADSKARLAALAKVQSYGGSEHGLDQSVSGALARSGSAIDLANSFRRGSLGAFQTAQAVNPLQIGYSPSPVADLSKTALQFGAQGLGSTMANAFNPIASGASSGLNLTTPVNWGGVNYNTIGMF